MRKNPHRAQALARRRAGSVRLWRTRPYPEPGSGRTYGGFLESRSEIPSVFKEMKTGEVRERHTLSLPAKRGPRFVTCPAAEHMGRFVGVRTALRTRFSTLKAAKVNSSLRKFAKPHPELQKNYTTCFEATSIVILVKTMNLGAFNGLREKELRSWARPLLRGVARQTYEEADVPLESTFHEKINKISIF